MIHVFGTHAFIETQQWFWTSDKFEKKIIWSYMEYWNQNGARNSLKPKEPTSASVL